MYNQSLCAEMQRLNLEIIPQGSLTHISVEPTFHDQVIMAQLHDKSVGIIKQKVLEGDNKYKCFRVDHKGIFSKITSCGNKFWMKHISLSFPFIRVAPKCTKISGKIFGGLE